MGDGMGASLLEEENALERFGTRWQTPYAADKEQLQQW
jgi:hypothetical protein